MRYDIRFSVWLRRKYDLSHFSIITYTALLSLVFTVSNNISKPTFSILSILATGLMALIALYIMYMSDNNAKLHNRPANVEPFLPTNSLSIFLLIFGMTSNILSIFEAENWITVISGIVNTIAMAFLFTPGYKVHHDPDNIQLSYAGGDS